MTDDPQAEQCPGCQHPQHAPGSECETRVNHSPNHFHVCLCLARPGAEVACPPQMTCQGGTLGYTDIWYLQRGHSLSGANGETITPDVLKTPPAAVPASTAPLAAGLPLVQGNCPACGVSGLFLGSGGYVTCSSADCPEPDAATTVLEGDANWPAVRAGVLQEALGRLRQVPFTNVLTELRRMADCHACEAGIEHDVHCPTPETHNWGCGCPTDPVPADGPSRMADEAQQPETPTSWTPGPVAVARAVAATRQPEAQADTALRIRVLSEILGRLTGRQDGDSATDDVPAATVRRVLAEILDGMQPRVGRGGDAEQPAAVSQPVREA